MAERVGGSRGDTAGFLLQPMIQDAAEMLVGIVVDPHSDRSWPAERAAPRWSWSRTFRSSRCLPRRRRGPWFGASTTFPLLDGFRGASKKDVDALVDVVVRSRRWRSTIRPSARWTATRSW